METQRLRRRRSRRRTRKRHVAWLIVIALAVGIAVWTRILIERRNDASMVPAILAAQNAATDGAVRPDAKGSTRDPNAIGAARNLVLFIGTGYGLVPMTAARLYAVGEDGDLAIDRLPETAMVRTGSHNAQTADSAAAMTAYLTGVRVDNEVLSQSADTHPYDESGHAQSARGETTCSSVGNGKRVATLLELAKASGRSVGIVTTGRVTQAITAAAYAHLCQRDGENTIATQLVPGSAGSNPRLGAGIDVILGGGWAQFVPKDDPRGSTRNDARDLFAEMRAKGYAVIARQSELTAAALSAQGSTPGQAPAIDKLIGLFNRSQMSYDIDRLGTSEPSLAEMTGRAIELLERNPAGYLLIVEGHGIGDALDGSLARKALQDARAYDDAIKVAIDKLRGVDPDLRDTLLVATADHDQTLVMNGNAATVERTIEARPGVLGLLRSYDAPAQFAFDATGRPYTTLAFGAGEKRVRGPRSQAPALTDLSLGSRDSRYEAAVETSPGSANGTLGGADVLLGAIGASAARFHGTIDNTDVFTLLRDALGL